MLIAFTHLLRHWGNWEFQSDLASQVMEEDKKKQVLGNGLPTETESPVVAKVK